MKKFNPLFYMAIISLLISPAYAQSALSPEEIAQAQRMAAEFQNDPKFKAQMQQIQKQMQKQGMKTDGMDEGMKNMANMNAKNMEAMMKMSQCMQENISEAEMKAMSAKGDEIGKKIKALCAAGKKSEAEKTAMDYGKKMMASREYAAMRQCSDKYKEAFQDPSFKSMREQMQRMEGKSSKKDGVCG